jgi:bacterioferritin-associated ferredoxin
MYVCLCRGVTEADLRELGAAGFTTAAAISAALRLRDEDCCGRCQREIELLVSVACDQRDSCDRACMRPAAASAS